MYIPEATGGETSAFAPGSLREPTVGATAVPMALASVDGAVVLANEAFRRRWGGAGPEEGAPIEFASLWASETRGRRALDEIRSLGSWSGELLARGRDGALFEVKLFGDVVPSTDGEPRFVALVFFDVSEERSADKERERLLSILSIATASHQKLLAQLTLSNRALASQIELNRQTEAELRALKDKHWRASEAKTAFIGKLSHEIRSTLNAILGYADLLRGRPLERDDLGMVERLYGAGKSLLAIIDDALDISRIEAGRLRLNDVPFSLADLVGEVVVMHGLNARRKGIELAVHLDARLPAYVHGDPTRLRQVLINLLTNSIKFTSRGAVTVRVDVLDGADGPARLAIAVEDTGIGIEPEHLKSIFEPFEQGSSGIARRYGGTGLGLAIVKQIIELMEGTIEVTSAQGQGTRFAIALPSRPCAPPLPGPNTPVPRVAQLASGEKVLVVDDHAELREIASKQLARRGFSVITASDGVEALDVLRETPGVAAVLMDIEMPRLDGLETTRQLKADPRHARVPVVICTALGAEDTRERCLALGADVFLRKPVDWGVVASTLHLEIEKARRAAPPRGAIAGERSVLVVDDSPEGLDFMQRVLSRLGVECTLASSGEHALELFAGGQRFDLLVSDRVMPGIGGIELVRRLRSQGFTAPVLLLTGALDSSEREAGLVAGCDEFILKPILPGDFARAVLKLLECGGEDAGRQGARHRRRPGDPRAHQRDPVEGRVRREGL